MRRWTSAQPSAFRSLALGLAIGLSFHVSPSLLPVALGLVAFEPRYRRPLDGLVLLLAAVPFFASRPLATMKRGCGG